MADGQHKLHVSTPAQARPEHALKCPLLHLGLAKPLKHAAANLQGDVEAIETQVIQGHTDKTCTSPGCRDKA